MRHPTESSSCSADTGALATHARSQGRIPRAAPPVITVLAALISAPTAGIAQTPGSQYVVDGRCVTITEVRDGQASYAWRAGNASGSGTLFIEDLTQPCTGPAEQPAGARQAAPGRAPPAERPAQGPAPGPSTGPALAGDTAFSQELVRAHNFYRCLHGVPPLQWNAQIAQYAQAWVEKAGFKHSNSYETPLGPMGENLYWSSGVPTGAEAVESWYGESTGYAYGGEDSGASGHFTAMIWKDARYVGCGRAKGTLSCNYSAGTTGSGCGIPNTGGCFAQQVRPPSRQESACR